MSGLRNAFSGRRRDGGTGGLPRLPALAVVALIAMVGLARFDLTVAVAYRRVPVVEVIQMPGRSAAQRLVVVDLGDRQRALRTGDIYLPVTAGETVCLRERTMLLRRWVWRSLDLPGFCRPSPAEPEPLPSPDLRRFEP